LIIVSFVLTLQLPRVAKNPKFHVVKHGKTNSIFQSTAGEVSFEWSHHRISATDSKVRTSIYSAVNGTMWKYYRKGFT